MKLVKKKKLLLVTALVIGAIVALVSISVALIANHANKRHQENLAKYGITQKACDLLKSSNARYILRDSRIKPQSDTSLQTSIEDTEGSKCVYTQSKVPPGQDTLVASLAVQTPTSAESAQDNKAAFKKAQKAVGVKNVAAYRDTGFWEYSKARLNVLKGNTWYTITYGSNVADNRSLSQTQELADLISYNLPEKK